MMDNGWKINKNNPFILKDVDKNFGENKSIDETIINNYFEILNQR